MSNDRGTFGALMEQAKTLGCEELDFACHLNAPPEDPERWAARGFGGRISAVGQGRTGEEALRRLVEKLELAHNPDST